MVRLSNAADDIALISLYGGQVLSWCMATCREQLYCIPLVVAPERAVSDGAPVCFPQLANYGTLAKHGFARTSVWQLQDAPITGTDTLVAKASFSLQDSPLTHLQWSFGFVLILQVQLGTGFIEWSLQVHNSNADAFYFTAALHTYLAVADAELAAVRVLAAVHYLDALGQNTKATSFASLLNITYELDRVYLNSPACLNLLSGELPCIRIEQTGFSDTVVWNPGPAKAGSLGDMPTAGWRRMLCIEAAQIKLPVHLLPDVQWQAIQRLTLLTPYT